MTPKQVAKAWHSVTDMWIVRRNKALSVRQWEVVHDWGGDLISDDTREVVARFSEGQTAELRAKTLENEARGAAVLAAISSGELGT